MKKLSKLLSLLLCAVMVLAPLEGLADELTTDAVNSDNAIVEELAAETTTEEELTETTEAPAAEEPAVEEPAAEEPAAEEPAVEEPAAEEPAAEEPAAEEPAVEEPAAEEPAAEEPAAEEPAAEEPAAEEPATEEPAVEEPAVEEPAAEEPAAEEPAVEEPMAEEPAVEEPAVEEPVVEEPAVEEPAAEEPVVEEPAAEEPAAEEPAAEEPAVEEPAAEEPAVEEPAAEEPAVEEPAAEEPAAEEPAVEEPAVEEPAVEEPAAEEPVVEEPAVEEPAAEEPAAEEPAVEEPAVEEPAVEEPVAEEPAVEEPVVEEPAVEEPVVEEPAAEEPAVEEPAAEEPAVEEPEDLTAKAADDNIVIDKNALDLTKNGWQQESGYWYYIENGAKVTSKVIEIDGAYYGFDSSGRMYKATTFSLNAKYYRANDDGKLYTSRWYEESGYKYFYGADAAQVRNANSWVNGKLYGFMSGGQLYVDTTFSRYIDGVTRYFRADADGVLYTAKWYNDNGSYYYYDGNGYRATNGILTVGGKKYGFNSSGRMYDDTTFSIYDSEAGMTYYYRAQAGGALYAGQWYNQSGTYYYYDADGHSARGGIFTIGGKKYGFSSSGAMYKNTTFNMTVDGESHYFRAKESGEIVVGWFKDANGNYYYGDANGYSPRSAVVTIGGKKYGFDYNGKMYSDTTFNLTIDGETRYFRAKESGEIVVGWFKDANGDYYYGDANGYSPRSAIVTIGGKNYGFNYNGKMYDDTSFNIYDSEIGASVYYRALPGGALATGWYKDEYDNWYYYGTDGRAQPQGIATIGGKIYGFNYDGRMYKGRTFGLYNEEYDKTCYYRARPDGTLYVNEWYQDGSTWCYYGAKGVAPNYETLTIKGVLYGFENVGRLAISKTVETNDGKVFVTDADGKAKMLDTSKDGWIQGFGNWYYVKDGELVSNEIIEVGGKYYYFGSDHVMRKDISFSLYDDEAGESRYYRASGDGSLYVNQWFEDYADWYYYGAKGAAPLTNTVVTIGGTKYVFGYYGRLKTSGSVEVDGVRYIADSKGIAHTVSGNGWMNIDGNFYYVKDGALVIEQVLTIGGKLYGFGDDGMMYAYQDFGIYDSVAGQTKYYRAAKDGSIYKGGWYQIGSRWYYADAQGVAPNETIVEIGGTKYIFGYAGELRTSGSMTMDGTTYIADAKGVAHAVTGTGWIRVDSSFYYAKDGQLVTHRVIKIGGTYYGFDYDGEMYTSRNGSFSAYFGDEGYTSGYFRAKDTSGALYINEWYQGREWVDGSNRDVWYYYGEGGKAVSGLMTIKDKTYLFNYNGRLLSGGAVSDGGDYYVADENGIATKVTTTDGWKTAGKNYYYFEGGTYVQTAIKVIGGKYYAFNDNGKMLDNNESGYVKGTENKYGYARAKAGGELYRGAWYQDGSTWFYYGADGLSARDVQTIGGKTYIFYSDGQLRRDRAVELDGKFYIADNDGIAKEVTGTDGWKSNGDFWAYLKDGVFVNDEVISIGGKYYGFNYNGRMYTDATFTADIYENGEWYWRHFRAKADGTLYTSAWYQENSGSNDYWYYYGANGAALNGIQKLDGKTYVFNSEGRLMYEGAVYNESDNINYVVDKDGVPHSIGSTDGWVKYDDRWYYIQDGVVVTDQVIKIGSAYYGFDDLGMMYTAWDFDAYNEDSDMWGWFRAKDDGTLYANTWFKYFDGTWYYYNADARAAEGIQTVGGTQYGFYGDGQLAINSVLYWEDALYTTDANGVATFAKLSPGDGWKQLKSNWYYVRNGELLRDTVAQIGSDFYGFEYDGRLYDYAGETFWMYDDDEGRDYLYRVKDTSGKLYANSWYQNGTGGSWYYYGAKARPASGLTTIGGKTYGFTTGRNGMMITNGGQNYDNVPYYMNASGIAAKISAGDGWKQYDSNWLYVKDGRLMTSAILTIAGKDYGFGSYGVLYRNGIFSATDYRGSSTDWGYFHTESDGTLYTKGWYKVSYYDENDVPKDYWYYFTATGKALTGIKTVAGKVYGFDSNGRMITNGMLNYHGSNYTMNASGVATDSGTKDGWRQIANDWFYVKNSKVRTYRWIKVGDKYYYFSQYGRKTNEAAA